MHELSIVLSIVDIATAEMEKAGGQSILEIELDMGCLSSIEMNAFEFAWMQGIKETALEHVVKKVNRIEGRARCLDCSNGFALQHFYDACPACGSHRMHILQGKELSVKTMVLSQAAPSP